MNYSRVVNILRSVFSVEVGLSDSEAQSLLRRMLDDPEQRSNVERKLESSLSR